VFDWLEQNIWSQASRYSTAELVSRACGEALNPDYFRAHLQAVTWVDCSSPAIKTACLTRGFLWVALLMP
jgi:hypothetical protein